MLNNSKIWHNVTKLYDKTYILIGKLLLSTKKQVEYTCVVLPKLSFMNYKIKNESVHLIIILYSSEEQSRHLYNALINGVDRVFQPT